MPTGDVEKHRRAHEWSPRLKRPLKVEMGARVPVWILPGGESLVDEVPQVFLRGQRIDLLIVVLHMVW